MSGNVSVFMRRAGRVAVVAAALPACCGALGAEVASAEVGWPTPTAQAVAMESEFLIDPAYPPPAQTAVCEIDSGVADSAVGEFSPGLLDRYTMQEGDPVTDTHAEQHGTWMARYMGAALDGVGMVGIWPGVRIVSVRALVGDGQTFPFVRYATAIAACVRLKSTGVPIVAISLSLGGTASPSPIDAQRLGYAVASARERGIAVLAAGGNEPGAVLSPAREVGVLGVGAGNAQPDGLRARGVGQLCYGMAGESPYPSDGRDLVGPGCFLDGGTADGQVWGSSGSSQATAMVAALYAAARAYNPSLTEETAERALVASSQLEPYGGWVSAKRFFIAAGIDWRTLIRPSAAVLEQPLIDPPETIEPQSHHVPVVPHRYTAPRRISRKRHGRTLTVSVDKRVLPDGAVLYLRALSRGRRTLAARYSGRVPRVAITLPYGTQFVDVRFRRRSDVSLDSKSVIWKTTVNRSITKRFRTPDAREFR